MFQTDTIAAIATAPGRGGVGIVRLSGPAAREIGQAIAAQPLQLRHAHYCDFRDAADTVIDSGIALYFAGPHSFTGEDVVELQGHGGPVVMDLLLHSCLTRGARQARPGEFSERAFLNDKLDLAQAEAIADLINSSTEQAARNATRSLQGAFSRRVAALAEAVMRLRVYVEAAIDFPEEEIDFLAEGQVAEQVSALQRQLAAVLQEARQGSLLREGMKLVIVGKPNAGKSSLLNCLSGQESAIVTDIAGTTRDVLREHIQIDGMPLHIVDTAGLRESGDAVEQEGIRRAWQEMASADRILLVVDSSSEDADLPREALWPAGEQRPPANTPVTLIHNKCDLSGHTPSQEINAEGDPVIRLCARSGEGVDLLRQHLKAAMGYSDAGGSSFSARRRHLVALQEAAEWLDQGQAQLAGAAAGELLAEDLRQCHNALGSITGAVSSDALLGEIFSSFCIGK
ncbi:tRNA modification GTPase [Haliea atlantica]|nr:tRNA uridine-5-carboxymethylaminomethyl(34) synthesis GTPase MnmE [Haliea sp.]MAL94995.1 tRNA uridine-5-carboxymethylaminomethyl(34) synthesis GTPase MnmE [Haliea sp.]|tara:strand:+ start:1752 stop:3119 length:1368 start_codon:yes stop_codon:yes gene_type:complete